MDNNTKAEMQKLKSELEAILKVCREFSGLMKEIRQLAVDRYIATNELVMDRMPKNEVYNDDVAGTEAISRILNNRQAAIEKAGGRPKNVRMVLGYEKASSQIMFFEDIADAVTAEDRSYYYNIFGKIVVETPSTKRIQIKDGIMWQDVKAGRK